MLVLLNMCHTHEIHNIFVGYLSYPISVISVVSFSDLDRDVGPLQTRSASRVDHASTKSSASVSSRKETNK